MRNLILALLTISLGTLWFFNFSAGIIGGVWLVLTEGLGLVLLGLGLGVIMPFVWTIAFLPPLLFAPLLKKFVGGRNRFLLSILGFIVVGYQYFLLTIWVTLVFGWLFSYSDFSPIALFLWGYAVVMGPLSYMYRKEEPDAYGSTLGILFAQLAYLTLSINLLISGDVNSGYWLIWFLLIIFTGVVVFIVNLYVPDASKQKQNNTDNIPEPKSIFKNRHKVTSDIARTLLVFYELIKKDKPDSKGEELYKAVLQTWNLNLPKSQIEISEVVEEAKHLGSRRFNWGDGINLRRIALAMAIRKLRGELYFLPGSPLEEKLEQFRSHAIAISEMEDEIEKIIPEGV